MQTVGEAGHRSQVRQRPWKSPVGGGRALGLCFSACSEPPAALLDTAVPPQQVGWGLWFCSSNKLSEDSDVALARTSH